MNVIGDMPETPQSSTPLSDLVQTIGLERRRYLQEGALQAFGSRSPEHAALAAAYRAARAAIVLDNQKAKPPRSPAALPSILHASLGIWMNRAADWAEKMKQDQPMEQKSDPVRAVLQAHALRLAITAGTGDTETEVFGRMPDWVFDTAYYGLFSAGIEHAKAANQWARVLDANERLRLAEGQRYFQTRVQLRAVVEVV